MQSKNRYKAVIAATGFSVLLVGCNSDVTPQVVDLPDTEAPIVSDVSLVQNPNPTVPLAAVLSLTTSEPSVLTVGFDDGDRVWSQSFGTDHAVNHVVPLIGMKANRSHTISVTVTDAAGNSTTAAAGEFTTPELPEIFPRPQVVVNESDRTEPGVNLFTITQRFGPGTPEEGYSPALMVDNEGEVLWYYYLPGERVHEIQRLSNGNFMYEVWPGTGGMVEIDLLGNVVNRWHFNTAKEPAEGSIAVATDSLHHDMLELPNGNLLIMSTEARVFENWYTSSRDANAPRQTATLIGDVIVEMTWDGEIVNEWKLFDMIDPYRIAHGSLRTDFWRLHYEGLVEGDVYDWSHGNAIIYEEDDHSFVISMPYQNAVAKVDMATSEIKWILGTPQGWQEPWSEKLLTPVGDVEWSYGHHAITASGRGTYLLFDNGLARAMPFDAGMPLADSYSRAVEYSVNEETMEVSQVWEYGPEQERFYGRYLGDVDWLPQTSNVLINVGGRETNAEGENVPTPTAQRWSSFLEVTSTDAPEKVWEMQLKEDGVGWSVYRVERVSGVYPY